MLIVKKGFLFLTGYINSASGNLEQIKKRK